MKASVTCLQFSLGLAGYGHADVAPHAELTASVDRSVIPRSNALSSQPQKIRFTPTPVGGYSLYGRNRLLFFESHRDKGMEDALEALE